MGCWVPFLGFISRSFSILETKSSAVLDGLIEGAAGVCAGLAVGGNGATLGPKRSPKGSDDFWKLSPDPLDFIVGKGSIRLFEALFEVVISSKVSKDAGFESEGRLGTGGAVKSLNKSPVALLVEVAGGCEVADWPKSNEEPADDWPKSSRMFVLEVPWDPGCGTYGFFSTEGEAAPEATGEMRTSSLRLLLAFEELSFDFDLKKTIHL